MKFKLLWFLLKIDLSSKSADHVSSFYNDIFCFLLSFVIFGLKSLLIFVFLKLLALKKYIKKSNCSRLIRVTSN